jgi:hypothetical protein
MENFTEKNADFELQLNLKGTSGSVHRFGNVEELSVNSDIVLLQLFTRGRTVEELCCDRFR